MGWAVRALTGRGTGLSEADHVPAAGVERGTFALWYVITVDTHNLGSFLGMHCT